MEMELIRAISQVGFPITITIYVMTRLERTVKENTRAIMNLTIKMKGGKIE